MSVTAASTLQARHSAAQGAFTWTHFWVVYGAAWFVFSIAIWTLWIIGPDFALNDYGVEDATRGYVHFVRGVEIASILAWLVQVWIFIVRPKIQSGRMSFDGMFFIACGMLYIQEPWINYNGHQFIYTNVAINFGSWVNYVPGWNSPNGQYLATGSIIWATAYLTLVALWAFCGSKFMGWLKARRPEYSNFQLIAVTFVVFIPFDLVLEHMILVAGLFNYASTVPELTLWAGQPYQFPIYETLSWCATLTGLAAIHFFRNDKGESWAERGISELRVAESVRTWFRFFAILGAVQLMMFLAYNVPYFYWSTKGGAFPDYPAYRVGKLCGPHTDYDCPGLDVPLTKADSPTNRILRDSL